MSPAPMPGPAYWASGGEVRGRSGPLTRERGIEVVQFLDRQAEDSRGTRDLPAAAPPTPLRLPETAPRAPHHLLASAAATPLGLPGLSPATPARHCLSVVPAASLPPGLRAARSALPERVTTGLRP